MKTNPDEPVQVDNGAWNDEVGKTYGGRGLTKREYFASMAMQGLVSDPNRDSAKCPARAVMLADLLIIELNKEQK